MHKRIAKTSSKNKFSTGYNPIAAVNINHLSEHLVRIESEIYVKSYGEENERRSNNTRKKVVFWTNSTDDKRG